MIGAVIGDIIGSAYEWQNTKSFDFELFTPRSMFTDDTVLSVAVADCILHGGDYGAAFKKFGRKYPHAGYGGMFSRWLASDTLKPYNSFGNGSAMRVSPIGFALSTLEGVLKEAKQSAVVTHDHPEGVKGAQAIAVSIFLARTGKSKDEIRGYVESTFGYELRQTLDEIRPAYRFDETCQGSVPQAVIAFLESDNYEDAIRKAVSLGGDSDTIACMTGGIAQAYYRDIPVFMIKKAFEVLTPELREIITEFNRRFLIT